MKIYRWTVIVLLFLLAVAGVVIACLIGCIDRNPVANEEGRVLSQVGISWVLFGFAAFSVLASVTVFIMCFVGKGLQVFSRITAILTAIIWGIAVAMVITYWTSLNEPLNEQMNGERLSNAVIWFYLIGGILTAILAMIAMMYVVSISIQDAGCEPEKVEIPVGMYKCENSNPVAKDTVAVGGRGRGARYDL